MSAAHVTAATLQATRAFAARVAEAYPTQQAILFGSRARGTEHDESDADVAVILKGQMGDFIKTRMAMNDIAYDILLDTGIRIQPLPVWDEFSDCRLRLAFEYFLERINLWPQQRRR